MHKILTALAVLSGVFGVFLQCSAYGTANTHPYLTSQIIRLYNVVYSGDITGMQQEKILQGSSDEDADPRWINHFYDPITGEGWIGKNFGDVPASEVNQISSLIMGKEPVSMLDWVHNQSLQESEYALYQGDRTFESAVLFYASGNIDEAYYTLGHLLHDLEDMAVPAHTRQDSHFDVPFPDVIQEQVGLNLDNGEPYEKWVENYLSSDSEQKDMSADLRKNYKPVCGSFDNCIKKLAAFSNENFFSSDTILDENYDAPQPQNYVEKSGRYYAYDKEGNILFSGRKNFTTGNLADKTIDLPQIHKAYWDRLSAQAVLAGTEALRYFYEQSEKVKNGEVKILKSQMPSYLNKLFSFSPYAQFIKMYNIGKESIFDFYNRLRNFGSDFVAKLIQAYDKIGFKAFSTSILPAFSQAGSSEQDDEIVIPSNKDFSGNVAQQNQQANDSGTGGPVPWLIEGQDRQEILDDIAEQLDIISQQVQELVLQRQNSQINVEEEGEDNENSDTETIDNNTNQNAGALLTSYPLIIISEVETAGLNDEKEEFVELYNPNDYEANLTGWYLQKKTKIGSDYSTFASSGLFSGKTIPARGYILIARDGYYRGTADIFTQGSLSDDNTIILKNPNRDITDKLGWGQAQDFETSPSQAPQKGFSIGRKVLNSGYEQDTNNNYVDFEIQTLTPKSKNVAYSYGGGGSTGGSSNQEKQKVLINEIQVAGAGSETDEFVELYNPGNSDISLTGWHLQKKTKTGSDYGTFVSATLFSSKTIRAKGYILISRTGSSFENISDVATSYSLDTDSSLILKDNNNNIIDAVGWGQAQDYEVSPAINPNPGESIQRKWDSTALVFTDTDNNLNDFGQQAASPKGSASKVFIEDTTDYSAGPDYDGAYYYNLLIKWNSPNVDTDYFNVQYRENSGDWEDWEMQTTTTQENFKAYYFNLADKIYYFRVAAHNIATGLSDWQELTVDLSVPVVVNEIAPYGTDSNPGSQWLELYNKSGKAIDLTGWKIISDGSSIELSGTIAERSFYVLEKDNDEVIADRVADLIFTKNIFGSYLKLVDSKGFLADEIYVPVGGWSQGMFIKNEKYYSRERISAYALGKQELNWDLNIGTEISGTPGSVNSIGGLYTLLPRNIPVDLAISETLNPYMLYGQSQVQNGAVFSLEPGVIVKAWDSNSGILVQGTLKATGDDSKKVVFTSFIDDEYGGDTNRDAGVSLPQAGGWTGITFESLSTGSQMQNCAIRYGGAKNGTKGAGITIDQADVPVKNCVFYKNLAKGLHLINSSSNIESNRFLSQDKPEPSASLDAAAIYVQAGSPQIENNYFGSNARGIAIDNWDNAGSHYVAGAQITGNTFEENAKAVEVVAFGDTSFLQNKASGSGINDIVLPAHMEADVLLKPDLPYLFSHILEIPENIVLNVEPGSIIEFMDNFSGIKAKGTLVAAGTTEFPIIMRHYYYNESWSGPARWLGLQFEANSQNSKLENIDISFAGAFYGTNFGAAIKVDQSEVAMKGLTMHDNGNNGIWLANSDSVIDSVQLKNHTYASPGYTAKAVYIQGQMPEVKNCRFDTQTYGIYLDKWHNEATSENVLPNAILHNGADDSDQNIFINTAVMGGDVFYAP